MAMRHTPGPWKIVGSEIWGPHVRLASGRGAYDEKDREKNKANARLIAAAPEMLNVLVKTYKHQIACGRESSITEMLRLAIESATGMSIEAFTQ